MTTTLSGPLFEEEPFCAANTTSEKGVRKLRSSMLGRPPATWRIGPGAPAGVIGTRSRVPLLKLLTHRAPVWNLSPLAPIGSASVGTGARAASVSHGVTPPPETGTDQMVPLRLSAM